METKLEERERLDKESQTGLDRFYEKFGHAEALGYQWEYQPPTREPIKTYQHKYATK